MVSQVASLAPTRQCSLLERLDDGEFLRRFLVLTVDIGAIRERLNHRWDRRKEQVWEHLERSLGRRLHGDEACERISETAFVVGLMRATRMGSVVVASHALQDTLHFFLGAALVQDINISEVVALRAGALNCRALDREEIRKAAASWVEGEVEGQALIGEPPKFSPTISLMTVSGQPIDVMIAVQRIEKLEANRQAAMRASPHITDARTGERFSNKGRLALDAADIAAIDTAVLGLARQAWEAEPELGSIMTPISFHTLSRTGARGKLLNQAGIIADESRRHMLAEIIDVTPGTPAGRICDAVAMTQAFSRGVFIEAHDPVPLKAALSSCRVLGLTFDASDWTEQQAAPLARKLRSFVETGKHLARSLVAHGLPSPSLIALCAAAGLSHAAASVKPNSDVVHINGREAAAH